MQRAESDSNLLLTRKHYVRDHIGSSIPGYQGHVPGHRLEDSTVGHNWANGVHASRHARTRATYDVQTQRLDRELADRTRRNVITAPRAPAYDNRGNGYLAAGDTQHSRIAVAGEEKHDSHFHASMGLTSDAHENRGAAGTLKGYGAAARGIPGYTGYIAGKHAENVVGDGWSKSHSRSLNSHFAARGDVPKKLTLMSEGRTLCAPVSSEILKEVPLKNSSYHDITRGWSTCEFTGAHIDAAGRLAPKDRQEHFGGVQPPPPKVIPIHGYAGWVPGRVGESVVGERQCKTNAISSHVFKKNRMRTTQR